MRNHIEFFETVIAKVQSKSIREWATSERNRPHWHDATKRLLERNPNLSEEHLLVFIIDVAMG